MVEERLISEKRVTRWQLQEIQKLFEIMNVDKTGELSLNDIGFMMQHISKGYSYEYEDLQVIMQNIGSTTKGAASWTEFLTSISIV